MEKIRIQLSPKRIVPGVLVVWNEQLPEVDIVMPIDKLSFAPGSVDEMYVFHVLEHLFTSEIPGAVKNWRSQVADGKKIYVVADDFELIARAFIGGEVNIDELNEHFSYPTRITRDNLVAFMQGAGFNENDMGFWFADVPNLFKKHDNEIVVSATKK